MITLGQYTCYTCSCPIYWTQRKFNGLRLETHKFEKRRRRDLTPGPLDHKSDDLLTRLPCFGRACFNLVKFLNLLQNNSTEMNDVKTCFSDL